MTPKLTKFYQFVHTKSKFHFLFLLYRNFSRSIIGFRRLLALSWPFAAFRGFSRSIAAFSVFRGLSRKNVVPSRDVSPSLFLEVGWAVEVISRRWPNLKQ